MIPHVSHRVAPNTARFPDRARFCGRALDVTSQVSGASAGTTPSAVTFVIIYSDTPAVGASSNWHCLATTLNIVNVRSTHANALTTKANLLTAG